MGKHNNDADITNSETLSASLLIIAAIIKPKLLLSVYSSSWPGKKLSKWANCPHKQFTQQAQLTWHWLLFRKPANVLPSKVRQICYNYDFSYGL